VRCDHRLDSRSGVSSRFAPLSRIDAVAPGELGVNSVRRIGRYGRRDSTFVDGLDALPDVRIQQRPAQGAA